MRQHITVEQLQNITLQQTAQLLNMPEEVVKYMYEADLYKHFTTGKMIEILYKYSCDVTIESAGAMWYITVSGHINTQDKELCNALWKAVKGVRCLIDIEGKMKES